MPVSCHALCLSPGLPSSSPTQGCVCVCVCVYACVRVSCSVVSDCLATIWTVTHQALLSMEFSRQESWNGLPCSFPGDLPGPGIEPRTFTLQADSLLSESLKKPINKYTDTYAHTYFHTYTFSFFKELMGR